MNKTLLIWQSDKYLDQDLIVRLVKNITRCSYDLSNICEIDSTFSTKLIGYIEYKGVDGFVFNLKTNNKSLSHSINMKFYAKGNDMITEFTQDSNEFDLYKRMSNSLIDMLSYYNIALNDDTTYNQDNIKLELIR